MLIPVIKFEIHNFTTNISEQFIVSNTPENQELVFTHRNTRNITFDRMFDLQFETEMNMPLEFISMATWMQLSSFLANDNSPEAELLKVVIDDGAAVAELQFI